MSLLLIEFTCSYVCHQTQTGRSARSCPVMFVCLFFFFALSQEMYFLPITGFFYGNFLFDNRLIVTWMSANDSRPLIFDDGWRFAISPWFEKQAWLGQCWRSDIAFAFYRAESEKMLIFKWQWDQNNWAFGLFLYGVSILKGNRKKKSPNMND